MPSDSEHMERRLVTVENQIGEVRRDLAGQGAKLDQIVNALTTVERSAQPKLDLFRILSSAAVGAALFGAVVSGITYISSNINASANTALKKDIEFITLRMERGWFTPAMNVSTLPKSGS